MDKAMTINLPLINDYSLCKSTITVYHYDNGEVTRTIIDRAYMEHKKLETTAEGKTTERNTALIVVPTDVPVIFIGDKVMHGEGPQVDDSDQTKWWRMFVPAKYPNLVVIKDVAPWYWDGEMVHEEAWG